MVVAFFEVDPHNKHAQYFASLLSTKLDVVSALDGQDALDKLQEAVAHQQPLPDVIVSDVMMPRVDGFRLISNLRSHPILQLIPVILVSARSGEEARVEGLSAGADDYLCKPFSGKELLARHDPGSHRPSAQAPREPRPAAHQGPVGERGPLPPPDASFSCGHPPNRADQRG
jgi:DNA-binding response OmpR family regulator